MNDLCLPLALLWLASLLLAFLGGIFFGIVHEADCQARRREAQAKRFRDVVRIELPLLLLGLLFLATPAWAAPRPKSTRPTPEQEFQRELQRFPSRELCRAYIDLATAHLESLKFRWLLHPEQRHDISRRITNQGPEALRRGDSPAS